MKISKVETFLVRWGDVARTSGIRQAACFIDRGLAISITLSPLANQAAGTSLPMMVSTGWWHAVINGVSIPPSNLE